MRQRTKFSKPNRKYKSIREKSQAAARERRREIANYREAQLARFLGQAEKFDDRCELSLWTKRNALALLETLVDPEKLTGKYGEKRKDSFYILCANLLVQPMNRSGETQMIRLYMRPSAWTKKALSRKEKDRSGRKISKYNWYGKKYYTYPYITIHSKAGQFVREIVPVMEEHGLIETYKGFHGFGGRTGKQTRIWPTQKFLDNLHLSSRERPLRLPVYNP